MKRNLPTWLSNLDKSYTLGTELSNRGEELQASNSSASPEVKNSEPKNNLTSENTTTTPSTFYSVQFTEVSKPNDKESIADRLQCAPLPYIEYKGRVGYYTTNYDIAFACDTLTKWVIEQKQEIVPIAFDMEWTFTYRTGSGKSSVIQLCADLNLCFVFQISELKKLPAALVQLLHHPKVCFHGVNIKNDCRKLERDFKEVNSQLMIDRCRDLGVWCNKVENTNERWSMKNLVLYICKLQINKDQKVRMSQWHIQPLTREQQLYAAIDVYISQVIYYELEKREKEKEKKATEFLEKYGEEAYNLVMKL